MRGAALVARLGHVVAAPALALMVALASSAVAAAPADATTRSAPSASCPPAPVTLTPERFRSGLRDAHDHGFLWRIVKDGRSSYLYGTIHAARLEWMFPGPRTAAALAASDTLALELDVLDREIQPDSHRARARAPATRCPPRSHSASPGTWPPPASSPLNGRSWRRNSRSRRWR